MVVRFLGSVTIGAIVGGVIHEALMAGFELLRVDENLRQQLTEGAGAGLADVMALMLIWLISVTLSVAMATALAGSRLAGWLCALMWLVPITLLAGLGGLNDPGLACAIVVAPVGAVLGTGLARWSENQAR